MTLEEGLVAYLAANEGVAALVGTRIYPLVVPQDAALPALAYQRISSPREHVHTGASGLVRARIQVTNVGGTYSAAKALAETVRVAMDGYSGAMGTVAVGAALLMNENDTWLDMFNAPVVRHDYAIWYQE